MNTLYSRLSAVFFYGITALLLTSIASAVTTTWMPAPAAVNVLRITEVDSLKSQRERDIRVREVLRDRAIVKFDLDADLSGVFNWNVKQLFTYVTADFATPKNSMNRVVIWDKIISNASSAHVVVSNGYNKYPIIDQHRELRDSLVSVTLHWDVMPTTGVLYTGQGGKHTVRFPADYCNQGKCRMKDEEEGQGKTGAQQ